LLRFFENKITQITLHEIENSMHLKVQFANVDILPLKKFPNLTIQLENFRIISTSKKEPIDSLLQFNSVYIAIKPIPLISGKFDIHSIELDGFDIKYHIDKYGKSNFDFLLASDTTASVDTSKNKSTINLILHNLFVKNLKLQFVDDRNNTKVNSYIAQLRINAKMIDDAIDAHFKGKIVFSDIHFSDYQLNSFQKLTIDCNMGYTNRIIAIDWLTIAGNGLKLETKGNIGLNDSTSMNLQVDLKEFNLAHAFTCLPVSMQKSIGVETVDGNFGFTAFIKGYYFDTTLVPTVSAKIWLANGSIKLYDYPKVTDINLNSLFYVPNFNDKNSIIAKIHSFSCHLGKSEVKFSGQADNLLHPRYLANFKVKLSLPDVKTFIPTSTMVSDLAGEVNIQGSSIGKLPNKINSTFIDYLLNTSTFELLAKQVLVKIDSLGRFSNINLKLKYQPKHGFVLSNFTVNDEAHRIVIQPSSVSLKLVGKLSNFKQLGVQVDTVALHSTLMSLNAKFKVLNLTHPNFDAKCLINLNLGELSKIIPDTLLDTLSGIVQLNIQSHGQINFDSILAAAIPIAFENSFVNLALHDICFSMKSDTFLTASHLMGNLNLANDTLKIDNFSGKVNQLEFRIDSTLAWNIYKSYFKKEKNKKLIASTNIWINKIDYDMLLPFITTDTVAARSSTNNADSASKSIPSYIIRGKLAIDQIKYNNNLLDNLSTKFRISDSLIVIDDLYFKGFEGKMTTSISYDLREVPYKTIEFKNQTQHINLKKILVDNDNFNQTEITDKNIDGAFSGTFYGRIVLGDSGILYDKINLLGNFMIENGGIYNYEPAMQLSKFTNLHELNNIIFRKLESSVFIYDNQIYFPKTDIVSSAMDLSVYGMASFGSDYEYHVIMYPSDILLGKSQNMLKKQGLTGEKFEGENQASRSGIYLVSLKKGNETKNGFDSKQLQMLMKTTIRVEERGLNLVFHPKVFNFSTDFDRKELKKKSKHESKSNE
jgi:hypothetical protein